ncbi:MAG: hypothetical protein HFE30_03985 [Clostridiales bacterium]|nr:hypothetical protein [Clostridiales bacterium]
MYMLISIEGFDCVSDFGDSVGSVGLVVTTGLFVPFNGSVDGSSGRLLISFSGLDGETAEGLYDSETGGDCVCAGGDISLSADGIVSIVSLFSSCLIVLAGFSISAGAIESFSDESLILCSPMPLIP